MLFILQVFVEGIDKGKGPDTMVLRGLGFCPLYCPLCFDVGFYSEMVINLRMIKQCT